MFISIFSINYGGENVGFYAGLCLLSTLILFITLYFVYEIPSWNQQSNYLPVMTARVEHQTQVGKLKLPKIMDLILESVGGKKKAVEICKILAEQGCGDSVDLLHFMQTFAEKTDSSSVGPFAVTLERLGIKPFDALRIAEHIGLVTLTHHENEASRHVPGLVA
mmetsp:Transcript_417/g.1190  ORF Transcript_417/g.1190 Transcript_417/m.1190 type:complete len:164 (-) Transcript_417:176-667(-)